MENISPGSGKIEQSNMPITIGAKRESDFADPIGMLGDCHRRIERFLAVLVAVAERYSGGPIPASEQAAFATSLRYFREAAPKHTADEEESLFPRLRLTSSAEAPAAMTRIDALEQDHECATQMHDEVDRLGGQWLDRGKLTPEETARLSGLLQRLDTLYRGHIQIEESEVFPLAAEVLTVDERRAIGEEMARRRGVTEITAHPVAPV